ncbi:hypothetical protein G3A_14725 [Bacillus sp. 17376]|nr:hypothetical protein G3A_14725 [Bacillus sp. 17376]
MNQEPQAFPPSPLQVREACDPVSLPGSLVFIYGLNFSEVFNKKEAF